MKLEMGVAVDIRKLQQYEKQAPGGANRVLGKLAFDGERYVKENFSTFVPSAPGDPPAVRTGYLKNSITGEQVKSMLWQIKTGTEYAVYLEYGTVKMQPRPFMHPMKMWLQGQVKKAFEEFYKK